MYWRDVMNNAWNASAALRKRLALDEVARETVDGWLRNRKKVAMVLSEARRPHLVFSPLTLCECVCEHKQLNEWVKHSYRKRKAEKKKKVCLSVRPSLLFTLFAHLLAWKPRGARSRSNNSQTTQCKRLVPPVARLNCIRPQLRLQPVRLHIILTHSCIQIFMFSIILAICVRRERDWTETDTPDGPWKVPNHSCLQVFNSEAQVELLCTIDHLIIYLSIFSPGLNLLQGQGGQLEPIPAVVRQRQAIQSPTYTFGPFNWPNTF